MTRCLIGAARWAAGGPCQPKQRRTVQICGAQHGGGVAMPAVLGRAPLIGGGRVPIDRCFL
jgi:hypothetical protein